MMQYTMSPEYAKADTSQMFQYQEEEDQESMYELALSIFGNLESEGFWLPDI